MIVQQTTHKKATAYKKFAKPRGTNTNEGGYTLVAVTSGKLMI